MRRRRRGRAGRPTRRRKGGLKRKLRTYRISRGGVRL